MPNLEVIAPLLKDGVTPEQLMEALEVGGYKVTEVQGNLVEGDESPMGEPGEELEEDMMPSRSRTKRIANSVMPSMLPKA
jgi:hypothetical protein